MNSLAPDLTSPDYTRLNYLQKHEYKRIDAPCNLIVEIRKFEPNVELTLRSVAWTIISLFDPAGDLNVGMWRCPMFKCPTKLGNAVEAIGQEPGYSGLDLCIRIGNPGNQKE